MIALERPVSLVPGKIVAETQRRFPQISKGLEAVVAPASALDGDTVGQILLKWGDNIVVVATIDAPFPELPVADGTWEAAFYNTWPAARKALKKHKAHIIVSALGGPADFAGCLEAARKTTFVAAVTAGIAPTVGVLWNTGETATPPERFQAAANGLAQGQWPLDVWVGMSFFQGVPNDGRPTLGMCTKGLMEFVGREIEFRPCHIPQQTIAERVLGAASYLLSQGLVLNDGDTLGVSESERIRITYADGGARPSIPILQLAFEECAR